MLKNNRMCDFYNSLYNVLNESEISKQLLEGRVVVLDTIHSTNQYIIDNLKYINSGDVFVTENQTQGRGRHGKNWIAPSGQSICLSVYWRLYQKLPVIIELSLMISFIVAEVLKNFGVSQIKIKWPNDLYVYNRKLAGVLIEVITKNNSISHVIIGIGINISLSDNSQLELQMVNNWIDLKNIGVFLDRNILISTLINMLHFHLKKFEYYDKYLAIFMYYRKNLNFLYKKPVKLFLDNYIIYGTVLGISIKGALLIMDKSGITHSYLDHKISVRAL